MKWLNNNSKTNFPITRRGPRFFKERRCIPTVYFIGRPLNNGIKRCHTFEWRAIIVLNVCFPEFLRRSSNRSRLEIEHQLDLARTQRSACRNVTFTFVSVCTSVDAVLPWWTYGCVLMVGNRMKHERNNCVICLLRKQLEAVYPANTRSNQFSRMIILEINILLLFIIYRQLKFSIDSIPNFRSDTPAYGLS